MRGRNACSKTHHARARRGGLRKALRRRSLSQRRCQKGSPTCALPGLRRGLQRRHAECKGSGLLLCKCIYRCLRLEKQSTTFQTCVNKKQIAEWLQGRAARPRSCGGGMKRMEWKTKAGGRGVQTSQNIKRKPVQFGLLLLCRWKRLGASHNIITVTNAVCVTHRRDARPAP